MTATIANDQDAPYIEGCTWTRHLFYSFVGLVQDMEVAHMVQSLVCEYRFTRYKLQLLIVIDYLEGYSCAWHDMLKNKHCDGCHI